MIKIITKVLCALFLAMGISSCSGNNSMKSNQQAEYAPEIQQLDSLRWLIDGPEFPDGIEIPEDSLRYTWSTFAELYSREEYKEAYDFLSSGEYYPNMLVYLRNSTAQYEFVSKIWSTCIAANADSEEEYLREFVKELDLCLLMTKFIVECGGEGSYIPPHYLDLVTDLGQILLYSKDYEKAKSFDREIYDATKVVYGDDTMARFHAVAYHCIYLCRVGQEGQAYKELDEFRNVAKEECSEELLERLLSEIDEIERSMIEEEQLNTILSN